MYFWWRWVFLFQGWRDEKRVRALSSFLPWLAPASRQSVRLETLEATFAPRSLRSDFRPSREYPEKDPVMTRVFPSSGRGPLGAQSSSRRTPAARSFSITSRARLPIVEDRPISVGRHAVAVQVHGKSLSRRWPR